jgi:hypothetical protein
MGKTDQDRHQQFQKFIARLSPEAQKARHKHIVKLVAREKRIAKKAKYAWSPYTKGLRVDVNQEFGREFLFFDTLMHNPSEIWSDPSKTRQLRKDKLWSLVRQLVALRLRRWNLKPSQLNRLTDFALPAIWIETSMKDWKDGRRKLVAGTKAKNTILRDLARREKKAKATADTAMLEELDRLWPREVEGGWAGVDLFGERELPIPLSPFRNLISNRRRPGVEKGGPSRPQVVAFREAAFSELVGNGGIMKGKATLIVDEVERALGISDLTATDNTYGGSPRVDAIRKSLSRWEFS